MGTTCLVQCLQCGYNWKKVFIIKDWCEYSSCSLSPHGIGMQMNLHALLFLVLCLVCMMFVFSGFSSFLGYLPNFYCRTQQYQAVIILCWGYHFSYLERITSLRPLCTIRGQSQTKQFMAWKGNIPVPLGLLEYCDYSGVSCSWRSKPDIIFRIWRLSSKAM